MEEKYNKNSIKKLLDRLQENSWELELLVSGFVIFGLFYAIEPTDNAFREALREGDILKDLYQTGLIAIHILIFNLIIHVIIRSLWIGALGVRYISGNVDIENLNYSKRFTNYLNKKIGSFDGYIERLEKLSSVIFAISFLLIFYAAAFFILLYLTNLIGSFASVNDSKILLISVYTINYLLYTGAVLTFIDYVTQGLLKKNKWIATLYFPFYWVFSYLTLSFLYRPLYYNLLDNKFGRIVSLLMLPYFISFLVVSSLFKEPSRVNILDSLKSSDIVAINKNYEDLVEKNNLSISSLTIQSRVITDPYIKVNIPLSDNIESNIFEFNKNIKPMKDKRGYKSAMTFGNRENFDSLQIKADNLRQEYVKTFQDVYSIKIDSISCKSDFVLAIEKNFQKKKVILSFETNIGTKDLAEGKHILVYSRKKHPDTDSIITINKIPFWYYKD